MNKKKKLEISFPKLQIIFNDKIQQKNMIIQNVFKTFFINNFKKYKF